MIIVIIVIIIYFFVYFKFYSAVSGFDQVFHFKILSNFFSVIFLIQGAAPFFPRCRDDAFAYLNGCGSMWHPTSVAYFVKDNNNDKKII